MRAQDKLSLIAKDLKGTEWMKDLLSLHGVNAYLVGGIVRDAFIRKESKDIDLVFEEIDLNSIKRILTHYGKIIETDVGDSFKVLKFVPRGKEGSEPIDIATPRQDVKTGSGHKGFRSLGVKSIQEDLKRRDFTINSMAFDITKEELIDPFDGKKDLIYGLIKATDDKAFTEDPLRLMRAIQFAARFNFDIDPLTKGLMKEHANSIKEITGERILEELNKIISKSGNIRVAFELMNETGLDEALLGSKLPTGDIGELDDLSFLYILSSIGGTSPKEFYMKRLKGNANTGKELEVLDNMMQLEADYMDTEDLRFEIFSAMKKAPGFSRSKIIPGKISATINKMKAGKIPLTAKDIQINGTIVEDILGIKGPKVGGILDALTRDSLMNRINWRDRNEMIKELDRFK